VQIKSFLAFFVSEVFGNFGIVGVGKMLLDKKWGIEMMIS